MSRPSSYTSDIAESICARLADGESLRQICQTEGMPGYATVRRWERENDEFRALSTRARETGCHALAEDCIQIADDGRNDWMETRDREGEAIGWRINGEAVQRSKLRIETRMRLLGKWLPKVYGDKLDVTSDGQKLENTQPLFNITLTTE